MADDGRHYQVARLDFGSGGSFILRWEDDTTTVAGIGTGPGLAEWRALIGFLRGKLECNERLSTYGRRHG